MAEPTPMSPPMAQQLQPTTAVTGPSTPGPRTRRPSASTRPTRRDRDRDRDAPATSAAPTSPIGAPPGHGLARVASGASAYSFAGASLRRMATHETGEYLEEDAGDGRSLHTHDEEHEHEHEHDEDGHELGERKPSGNQFTKQEKEHHSEKRSSTETNTHTAPVDEEAAIRTTGDPPPEGPKGKYDLEDQTNLLPMKQVMMIFAGLNCAVFCSLLDQTIVTTALPTLGKVFNQASISTWVGTAYMLTSTALQPVYGRLSDIFGRKAVLLVSLTIFLFGSLACALAQTMIELIVFRALQGIGGGGILTLAMIIISDVVSLKDRGKYQGITGGVVAVANSLGPILGGVFTERVGWRWCFYINLPLTSLAMVVIFFLLPLKKVQGSWLDKLKKIDFYGCILTLAWAILVLLALSWSGTTYAWSSAAVLAPLIIGIALLFVFLYVEAKLVPLPLVPMYIFKDTTVAASMATTFCNGAAFYSTLYFLPQYFQVVRGETPIQSGIDMLPLTFVQVFCSFGSGLLVSHYGEYYFNLLAGFAIWTVGLGMMSTMSATTPKAHIYGFQVLVGVGAGQTFQTSLIAIQASVARKDMATATGCRNFLRMLGGTVALAACAAIVNNLARTRLDALGLGDGVVSAILQDPTQVATLLNDGQVADVRRVYAQAIDACFWLCIPMAGVSFFITLFFVKRISLKREDDAALKAQGKAWVEEEKARKRAKREHGEDSHHSVHSVEHKGQSVAPAPSSERTLMQELTADAQVAAKEYEQAAVGVATEKHR